MRSLAMRDVERVVRAVATKDVTVTLIGESGSGKEVLARRIHEDSERRRGPFVPINCAAIPESLFESELFGHERGAFTGATGRAKGKVEAAEGGTLFFDEIGEMPLPMQAKLLRFLESRRFMRIGGVAKIQANVRLVVATLRPLDEEVRAGRFRADLYYRIQGITIQVPSLRARRTDIPLLLKQFLAQLSALHETVAPRFSRAARAALLGHDWPGNVRELKNTVEMICLLRAGKQVRLRDLPEAVQRAAAPCVPESSQLAAPIFLEPGESLDGLLERVVAATLETEGGNCVRAAERLGVSVRTIQRRVARGLKQRALR